MAIVFARERLTDAVWEEAMPLLHAHWREVAHYEDIALQPDRSVYAASDAAGLIRFYSARADARLVGYALFFVRPNPHYAQSVQAAQDVLYVDPAYRGLTGYRLIQYADEQLRSEGVQAVYHHQKRAHPQLGRVLERLGYEPVDVIWARRLDRPADGDSVNGDHGRDSRGRGLRGLAELAAEPTRDGGSGSDGRSAERPDAAHATANAD